MRSDLKAVLDSKSERDGLAGNRARKNRVSVLARQAVRDGLYPELVQWLSGFQDKEKQPKLLQRDKITRYFDLMLLTLRKSFHIK